MFKNIRNSAFLKNNNGSSIITVLITMLFVAALGMALLFMSYTGLMMRVTESKGVQSTYSGVELMDQIMAGYQRVATELLTTAYQYTIVHYEDTDAENQENFVYAFKEGAKGWKTPTTPPFELIDRHKAGYMSLQTIHLFLSEAGVVMDESKVMGWFYNPDPNLDFSITAGEIDFSSDTEIIIEDIVLVYDDPENEGFEITVSTDIVLNIPEYNPEDGWTLSELVEYRNWSTS